MTRRLSFCFLSQWKGKNSASALVDDSRLQSKIIYIFKGRAFGDGLFHLFDVNFADDLTSRVLHCMKDYAVESEVRTILPLRVEVKLRFEVSVIDFYVTF